jgi:sugar lactone lactonase YvrE
MAMSFRRTMLLFSVVAVALATACGGDGTDHDISVPGSISLLAGSLQSAGSSDGVGVKAQFNQPRGVAQDLAGTIYVADSGNHTIRKIAPDGTVSTLAGAAGQAGSVNGTGGTARFSSPRAVAVDGQGNLYVADTENHTIRKISPAGAVSTLAGLAGHSGAVDGAGSAARFVSPHGLALDAAGNLFIADQSGALRKVARDGTVSSFAGQLGAFGFVVGDGAQARFNGLSDVAVDDDGRVYVAESGAGKVRRFDAQARALPWGDAPQGVVAVPYPVAIAAGPGGELIVASSGVFAAAPGFGRLYNSILRITSAGTSVPIAGKDDESLWIHSADVVGSADGPGAQARFDGPEGVAVGNGGRILVADSGNHAIRQIGVQGVVSTLAGGAGFGRIDGLGTAARFFYPAGIAAASNGSLYVVDSGNHLVRRVGPAGEVSTPPLCGHEQVGSRDSSLGSLAVAPDGTLHVSHYSFTANRGVNTVTVMDGSGNCRESALGNQPYGMAAMSGVLYDTDIDFSSSPSTGRVHKLLPDGSSQVVASGFRNPQGIAVNGAGTLFIADFGDHTVSSIDPQGTVRLLAGKSGEAGYADGAGNQARFDGPSKLAVDDAGNLYVADASTIRKITLQGQVTTIAGAPGQTVAQPGPLPGAIGRASGLAWSAGMLYATAGQAVIAIGPVK